jgi:putative hydrolase of the HAD superfamily
MPIRAVLFDMFDTLMLIEKNHAFYSPSLKKAHNFLVKNGVDVEFRAFKDAYIKARNALYSEADTTLEEPHFNRRISNALRSLGYVEVQRKIVSGATNKFCEGFMEYVRIDDHARSTLEKLYGKYKIGIVSNFAIPECVDRLLEKNGLEKFFDVVVVSATVNKRKPSPEIFQKALEKLDVRAENTVFVGDTIDSDIIGAKAAGMKSIFIERRVQEGVNQACPNEIIKSLDELLEAMKNY